MDSYLGQGLFWISIFALLFMISVFAEDWFKKHKHKMSTLFSRASSGSYNYFAQSTQDKQTDKNALLVLSVMAKPGHPFGSYDLLQAISAAGLQYGDMNIFHYYPEYSMQERDQRSPLFSLVSAEEPGDFNLDQIGNFSCQGLMLFMQLNRSENVRTTFQLMLSVAEHLAEDLEAQLCADPKTPWTHEIEEKYLQKIAQFQPAGMSYLSSP
ncbi:MAG: cell division protein ZipA C-terminal FtsZ-binding domain-containing protein [Gammaproteobacteria bacterium]|nr:cell division protein ZipA C-terminal FtsZ-binding domain-containing protein [Gammaproteobacteria bacterium]